MKKKLKKAIFIQDCGQYSNQILVAIDSTKDEIVKWCRKEKLNKDVIEWVEGETRPFEIIENNSALTCFLDGKFMLLLKEPNNGWDFWHSIIHELHHITYFIAKQKMFEQEMEAQAYLQEYLFKKIRKKLWELKILR